MIRDLKKNKEIVGETLTWKEREREREKEGGVVERKCHQDDRGHGVLL